MRYIIDDARYHFHSAFDTETGAYVRTGILDENGRDTVLHKAEEKRRQRLKEKQQVEEDRKRREEVRLQREVEKERRAKAVLQRKETVLQLQELAKLKEAKSKQRLAEDREQAKAERARLAAEAKAQREQARQEAIAKAEILYAPGKEPETLRARLDTLFAKLDMACPDKQIFGLNKDHKKWGETVTELYRKLGYADSHSFLEAYGYTVVQNTGGRPTQIDPDTIIEELHRRYPNGGVDKVATLESENPDIPWKTLKNKAVDYFGDSLVRYLKSIGLISGK